MLVVNKLKEDNFIIIHMQSNVENIVNREEAKMSLIDLTRLAGLRQFGRI